jgi:hypothetical protein
MTRKRLLLAFVLMLCSVGSVVVLLELTSLLVDWGARLGVTHDQPWREAGNRSDPDLLWTRQPNLALRDVEYRGNIARSWCLDDAPLHSRHDLVYDANGFRNATTLSVADIAVVGDSYVEAPEVPDERRFTTRLASLSGRSVANLGLSGYGPQQELIVLERFALPLGPEVVVWAFYEGNDLADLAEYERLMAEPDRLRGRPRRSEVSFVRNAARAVRARLQTCEPSGMARTRSGVLRSTNGRTARMYFVDGDVPLGPTGLGALTRFGTILARAAAAVRERGIDLVVVFVPTKFRVYGGIVELPADSDCRDWIVDDLPERLRALAREISPEIGFLDLTPALVERAAAGDLVYLLDDTHWTPLGHEVVAQAIHEFLSRGDREGR